MLKEIKGYENYLIDEKGNIFSRKRHKFLKTSVNAYGYPSIYLSKDGVRKFFTIHKLVALTFIPNPENYKEVNHKDENKRNNSVENLEWCSRKYNNNYGTRLSKISKKVECIETGEIFYSTREAGRQMGVNSATISLACNGKRKTAGGYRWHFVSV